VETTPSELERQQLLAAIERKGAEWMLTFDSIELPIFLITAGGVIGRVNRAARDLAGLRYRELVGRPVLSLGNEEPWRTLHDIVIAVHEGGASVTAQSAREGTMWDVSASLLAPLDADEERRVIVVLRDVTEIVRLQESVRRGEQLAALGELVAGVAHEVRNPLFGMSMTLDVLEERIRGDRDNEQLAATLREWVDRLNGLMKRLLEYGRTWSVDLKAGDAGAVVRQAVEGCRARAGDAGVAVDFDDDAGLAVALMDGARLVQVFENLLLNAIQHSPRGARVTVTARREAGEVEYEVRDRGAGFDPADGARVFQPFFTRREGGTGLGLAIVQRIVEEHGGSIDASNHPEGGAVVRMRLPLYAP
jgi:PAS domain S-box-containing protein